MTRQLSRSSSSQTGSARDGGLLALVCLLCASIVLAQPAVPPSGPANEAARRFVTRSVTLDAQAGNAVSQPSLLPPPGLGAKPIVIEPETELLEKRLGRAITLDVRDMNVIDVLKFLAFKGDFNLVTSGTVAGRVTIYLKNVSIQDALDIILISNNLAYHLERNIVHVMSQIEYEAMLGKRFNDKMKVEIVRLNYAKPAYVLSTLDSLKSNLGRIIIDEDTGSVVMIDTPQSIAKMKAAIENMESPLEAVVYPLQYAKADVTAEKLRARIDAHTVGSITVDERTNRLVVRALPGRREEVEKLIRSLDIPTKEVLVEARILKVVFKPQMDYGIDWDLDFSSSSWKEMKKVDLKSNLLNESGLTSSDNLLTRYGRLTIGDINVNDFEASIRALKQVSDTKILSNPKILVTNNEEAKIHVGDTIPYIISTTSGTGDNAITSEDVRFVDVGLKLNVTPMINDDGFITMRLRPEISTVVDRITSQGGGIPQVNKTEVETTVMVKDGNTIILGGLKKDNKVSTKRGIPFLMDIPYINKLFSQTSESLESTEIVIFITPHIITGAEAYDKVRGEIKPPNDFYLKKDGSRKEADGKVRALKLKD
ncbi:MAG: secretin N-terminal domain-containing protein [Candidatus Omnitrophota bacterium]|nr:secretin N-terminal domain-containing protein [Candidatus Omnitrophota bacterium]